MFCLFKDTYAAIQEHYDFIQHLLTLHFLVLFFFIILPLKVDAFNLQGNIKKTQNKNQNTQVKFLIITCALGKEVAYLEELV